MKPFFLCLENRKFIVIQASHSKVDEPVAHATLRYGMLAGDAMHTASRLNPIEDRWRLSRT